MKRILKSQQGFSLVELMVVVAIIGILAAMSVGQVNKQIAKSRQSEVKTNLSSIFTAQKSFYSEFGAYTSQFRPLNLNFEGSLRYDVGFSANFAPPVQYTGALSPAEFAANDICTLNANVPAPPQTCTLNQTNGVAPAAPIAGAVATAAAFTASGSALIFANNTNTQDQWTINNSKVVTNTVPGIF